MSVDKTTQEAPSARFRLAWEALEDAFENNAPEVHSYLNSRAETWCGCGRHPPRPATHARIWADPGYMPRRSGVLARASTAGWSAFIATGRGVRDAQKLVRSIDGKKARVPQVQGTAG